MYDIAEVEEIIKPDGYADKNLVKCASFNFRQTSILTKWANKV